MLVSQAISRVKKQFGDEYGVVIEDVDIYNWIHDAEVDIIRSTGCNGKTVTVPEQNFPFYVSGGVNVERIALNGVPLIYIAVEELDLLGLSTAATGEPKYWYKEMENQEPTFQVVQHKVSIWPTTTQTRNFVVSYVNMPTLMGGVVPDDNKFTVPEAFQEDVIKYCIGRAHNKNNNLQAEKMQMDLYDRNLNIRRDEAQTADVVLYKIGDPMDFEQVEYN